MEETDAYTISEKGNMDLIFFLGDGLLLSDQNYSLDNLDNYGYRSINILNYSREILIVLYAHPTEPKLLSVNESIQNLCAWIADT